MTTKTNQLKIWAFRIAYLALAAYAYFGGRCPAQGCPACRALGK